MRTPRRRWLYGCKRTFSVGLRIIFDANVLVSAMLNAQSTSGRALAYGLADATLLLCSAATMKELLDVVARPKFDR